MCSAEEESLDLPFTGGLFLYTEYFYVCMEHAKVKRRKKDVWLVGML